MSALNFSEMHELCLICLTKSSNMLSLDSPLLETENSKISIMGSLEKIMSWKFKVHENYPSKICFMCKSLLKMAHDLYFLFYKSQEKLTVLFKDNPKDEETVPVEIIFGEYTFDLNDILIVENEVEEKESFDGFLKNLGTAVSAVFVDNNSKNVSAANKQDKSANYAFLNITETAPKGTPQKNDNFVFPRPINNKTNTNTVSATAKRKKSKMKNPSKIGINRARSPQNSDSLALSPQDLNIMFPTSCSDSQPVKIIYRCKSCDTEYPARRDLMIHTKKCKFNQSLCKNCGEKKTSARKRCNFCKIPPQSKKIVKISTLCDICGHVSSDQRKAQYHRQKHFGRKFECHMCQRKFFHKFTLNTHLKSHENIRNHLCTICGKDFFYSNALVYHMRMHTNERKFVCVICDKRFYMSSSYKRHMRTHTDDRPYVCKFCEKGFRSNGEKRKHEMIHTGERPYKCRFCEKTFISKYNRTVHHMSHAGPHECEFCQKSFVEIEFLKKHIEDKHRCTD